MSRKQRIEQHINREFSPGFLLVEDESKNHHVPVGAETHFKITMVSPLFANTTRIARHRMLNQLLVEEFDSGLHALSMHLYTADEWEKINGTVLASPSCKDGYKNK